MDNLRKSPGHKKRRTPERKINILGSGVTSIRAFGITLLIIVITSRWWMR
jgi:hypothetical protein